MHFKRSLRDHAERVFRGGLVRYFSLYASDIELTTVIDAIGPVIFGEASIIAKENRYSDTQNLTDIRNSSHRIGRRTVHTQVRTK